MKLGRDRLLDSQKPLYNNAIKIQKHKISLFEAPTGFGKSVIINTIAETLAQQNKSIIIVTPTNQLAIEQLNIFKNNSNFTFDKNLDIDIVVGKSNYFDVNNFKPEVFEYINQEDVNIYIKNIQTNEDYLIEKLFDNIEIEEPNKKIVQEIIASKEKKDFMKDFGELNIHITNMAYLLTNVFYVKDFDISQFIVICDEVHQFVDIAENMLTNSFSIFRYNNIHKQLLNELQNQSPTLTKQLTQKTIEMQNLLNKYSNPVEAGNSYTINPNQSNTLLSEFKASLFKQDEKINKELSKLKNIDNNIIKLYNSEKQELLSTISTSQDITVYLSPSRGYPTLNSAKGDIRGWLLTYFWDKVETFIGLSATLNTSIQTKSQDQAFARLGIARGTLKNYEDLVISVKNFINTFNRLPNQDDTDHLKLYEFIQNQRKGYKEGWLQKNKYDILIENLGVSFFAGIKKGATKENKNERVEHIKYGVITYKPVFKKEQTKIYLPSEDLIKPQQLEIQEEKEWFDMVSTILYQNHHNKNTLVLCGSFYEVEQITQRLTQLDSNINIIPAQRNISTSQTVEKFKKEGGILIGTRNYGTGLNLPKKQLEKLFIVKLPFPIFTNKKWLDIKNKNKKFYYSTYLNEMIISFRQWIGRLIRTKDDYGELYIIDSRINDVKYKKQLLIWLERTGIIQDEKISYKQNNNLFKENKKQTLIQKINNLDTQQDVKNYLILNIDDMINHHFFTTPTDDSYDRDFKKRYRIFRKQNQDLLKI